MIYQDYGITGVDPSVLEILSRKLEFSFDYQYSEVWGAEIGSSGLWSGTIGAVSDQF